MIILKSLFESKEKKPKEKIEQIRVWVIEGKLSIVELIDFAKISKDPIKASCIEALEFITSENSNFGTNDMLEFAIMSLKEKAPRIKWESAKVIGNIAMHFPNKLDNAIINLLDNSEHQGTVVRWSAAYALTEIFKINNAFQNILLPSFKAILEREEKESIKKIYLKSIKK